MSQDPIATLRPPQRVMRLSRMGSAHPSRLSFLRVLLRRMQQEQWRFERRAWEMDDQGYGHAVYTAHGPRRAYSLVAFSHALDDSQRSDRVIAEAWDATFALYDGIPDDAAIARLAKNVPLQEAGRVERTELSLSRANKSLRLWQEVLEHLSQGTQPPIESLNRVGYLMRTTAVYGAGKFGAAGRSLVQDRELMGGPFRLEMLSVYLTRAFTVDLIEHVAKAQAPETAVRLAPSVRRVLGVGNSTGLGMAPFLINHPTLVHRWMLAKETALARVLAVENPTPAQVERLAQLCRRALKNAQDWHSEHPRQAAKLKQLRHDLKQVLMAIDRGLLQGDAPFDALYQFSQDLDLECQEQVVSLLLEVNADLVDDLAEHMSIDESAQHHIDGKMTREQLLEIIEQHYAWALSVDYQDKDASARYWYISEQKLEPRLGERYEEDGEQYEQPLDIGRSVSALHSALSQSETNDVAEFLLQQDQHRHTVRRVQRAPQFPYAEVQDNLIDRNMVPLDLLRCKLAFFGANRFDPRSDRWLRIALYQGAPYPDELAQCDDDWFLPEDSAC